MKLCLLTLTLLKLPLLKSIDYSEIQISRFVSLGFKNNLHQEVKLDPRAQDSHSCLSS